MGNKMKDAELGIDVFLNGNEILEKFENIFVWCINVINRAWLCNICIWIIINDEDNFCDNELHRLTWQPTELIMIN